MPPQRGKTPQCDSNKKVTKSAKPKALGTLRNIATVSDNHIKPQQKRQKRVKDTTDPLLPKLTARQKRHLSQAGVLITCSRPRLRSTVLPGAIWHDRPDQHLSVELFWQAYAEHLASIAGQNNCVRNSERQQQAR